MKACFLIALLALLPYPLTAGASVVDPKEIYTYKKLTEDIVELSKAYPDLISYQSLTTTPMGREVWAIKIGKGETRILLNGAHHAREWMTSSLLMKMIETYANAYQSKEMVEGIDANILENVSIWFVPMVNPDGVTLQQSGLDAFPRNLHRRLKIMNKGSTNFIRWKANLHGIDLNRQYPANWENLKGVKKKPNYQFYKGTRPLEALEVKALVNFTREINPEIAVAYHSSGNVLFWGFHLWGLTHTTEFTDDYYAIAEKVADITGYKLEEPATHQQGGGYTDWFIQEFEKPGLTIEIGNLVNERSLPLDEFGDIWDRNKTIGLFLANRAIERQNGYKKTSYSD